MTGILGSAIGLGSSTHSSSSRCEKREDGMKNVPISSVQFSSIEFSSIEFSKSGKGASYVNVIRCSHKKKTYPAAA